MLLSVNSTCHGELEIGEAMALTIGFQLFNDKFVLLFLLYWAMVSLFQKSPEYLRKSLTARLIVFA